MTVFEITLSVDKNTDNDHWYRVKTHEEVITLIRWAKAKGQKIKSIKEKEVKII